MKEDKDRQDGDVFELSEAEKESLERECLLVAYNALNSDDEGITTISIIKAFAAVREKDFEITRMIRKREKAKNFHFFIDTHNICASAVFAFATDMGLSDVHPYCKGAGPFLAFARAAVCLDHMSVVDSVLSDGELFGGDAAENVLKIA